MTEHEKDPESDGTDQPGGQNAPGESTEEYLLGALDDESQPPSKEAESSSPSEAAEDQPAPEEPPAEPGEYVEQPTEEVFALEAKLLDGDEVPELDAVFRAALLESPESATQPPADEESDVDAADGEGTDTPGAQSGEGDAPGQETGQVPSEDTAEGTAGWELPSEGAITAEQTAILAAEAKSDVHQAIETSRKSGEPWDPRRPSATGDFEAPAKRRRYWWRFSLATLVIVFSFAGATSASIMNVVNDITAGISDDGIRVPSGVLPKDNGGPQTIAILGSDVRTGGGASAGDPGRSDTTMLLRLDPDSGQIAMLSIPRDLKVEIPGYGTDKFNAAFSYGGPQLTLKTIKSVTGLDINHVINVDFQGFAEVVDAIGCVFVDVDRDYFNDNSQGGDGYATIDIDAGYQKLCGPDALEYARYRHTDSDLARASRQQDLVSEVRNRLNISEFIKRRSELIKAFTDNTKSDISGSDESLQILKLLFDSRGASVVEVKFPSTFTYENDISYVEATPEEINVAVDQFLGFEDQAGPVGTLAEGDGARTKKQEAKETRRGKKGKKKSKDPKDAPLPNKDNDGLVDASSGGQEVARSLDSEMVRRDFPVFYPRRLPSATIYAEGSRTYHVRDPDKKVYSAYRTVMALERSDGIHYFGLQGLRGWGDPPILQAPHDEINMDDRDFRVYWEGDRIRLVSWTEGDNTYWISNSILLTLENEQMLGMARSSKAFTPN